MLLALFTSAFGPVFNGSVFNCAVLSVFNCTVDPAFNHAVGSVQFSVCLDDYFQIITEGTQMTCSYLKAWDPHRTWKPHVTLQPLRQAKREAKGPLSISYALL